MLLIQDLLKRMETALNLKGNVQQSLDRPDDAQKSYLAALKLVETSQNDHVVNEALGRGDVYSRSTDHAELGKAKLSAWARGAPMWP